MHWKPRNSKTKVYTVLLDTLQIPLDNMDKLNSIFFVQCQLGMNYIVVCYFHKYVIHRKLCNSTYIFNIISFPNFWSKESGVPRFFVGAPVNFRLIRFFDPSTPSMRKVDDKEKKKKENNDVYSGHLRRCQSTAQTLTDWNAARSCQYMCLNKPF